MTKILEISRLLFCQNSVCLCSFYFIIHAYRNRGGKVFLFSFVCLSVFPHDISITDAAKVIKLDTQKQHTHIQMFHDESWKPIYFGGKRQSQRSVTKAVACVFELL